MIFVLAGLAFLSAAVVFAIVWARYRESRQQKPKPTQPDWRVGPGLLRTFMPQVRQLAGYSRILPLFGLRERYTRLIDKAGLPFELNADEFLAIKAAVALVTIGGALVFHLVLFQSWAIVAALSFLGLVYPDLYLAGKASRHEQACFRALPGFMDLLALSVEAGMGFDSAVLKLTDVLEPGPLTMRFKAYLRSVNVGRTHAEALREMARKLDMPDFTAFSNAVVQAAETGASLAPVLRTASIDMLSRRFERAEKMAHELPVKILLPLFLFVFPSTFLMILVPLWFQFRETAAGVLL